MNFFFTRLAIAGFFFFTALLPAMHCAFSSQQMERCMRHDFHDGMAILLNLLAVFTGIFSGVDLFKNWGASKLAGWLLGIAVYAAAAFLFIWTGFALPHSE